MCVGTSDFMLLKPPIFASRYPLQNCSGKGSSVLEFFLRILVIMPNPTRFSLYVVNQKPTMNVRRFSDKRPLAENHAP